MHTHPHTQAHIDVGFTLEQTLWTDVWKIRLIMMLVMQERVSINVCSSLHRECMYIA